jgi:LysM repeat protein
MKILKIFGAVVGIHLFALVLIFANPGCSSTSKPPPAPIDTVAQSGPSSAITVPTTSPVVTVPTGDSGSPVNAAPINFNPDAPASAAPGGGIRFVPTRPNTPVAGTLVAAPVTDVTPAVPYVVKPGDSLWSIATKNHLSVPDLAAVNNLKASAVLQPGQKLIVPSKAPTSATTAIAAPAKSATDSATAAKTPRADAVKYTVKSGETLSIIAKNFGVKQSEIILANNITDPAKIRAGMVLVIPGDWQAPGSKAAKPAAKTPASATTAKPAAEPAKPLFVAPGATDADSPVKAAPTPSSAEVPVIKVDETPAPKKP